MIRIETGTQLVCLPARSRVSFITKCLAVLEARFGDVPGEVVDGIESMDDGTQLRCLVRLAASCPHLDAFRDAVVQQ
jgi:hypothetical protein